MFVIVCETEVYSTVNPDKVFVVNLYWLEKSAVAAVLVTLTVPVPVIVPWAALLLMTSAAAGVNVPPPLLIVNVPETLKLPELVTAAPAAIAKFVKFRAVPPMEIDEPLFMVTVPLGEKVFEALIVRTPPTLKLADGCDVGVAATVSPEKVIVPGEAANVKPTALMVTVPLVPLKLAFEGTVRVALIL